MRILFIEDDAMNRRVVRDMLHVAGLPLGEADGGRAGIEALERDPYDVVLLDLRMPEMDGFDVLRALRSRTDHLARIPVIVVTADASPGLDEQCFAAGADAVMHKPIAMQAMFDTIARVLMDRGEDAGETG